MSDTHRPGDDSVHDSGRDSSHESGHDELDLYVDGLLDDERRAAFERRLFAEPGLAAELERQRSLEARLTTAFPVPEEPGMTLRGALAGGRPAHAGGRRLSSLGLAWAASLLAALGLWAAGVFDADDQAPAVVVHEVGPAPALDGPGDVFRMAVGPVLGAQGGEVSCAGYGGLYAELADEWRQAALACGLPHDLARHFRDSLGQELLADATDELPIEGPFAVRRWPTATLLVSPQQPEPILILVDELARDPRPVLEAGSPAHLFRRELGDLVLYEFTPWDRSRALELFRLR